MEHGERQRKITFHPINILIRRVRSWLESTPNWKSFRAIVFDNVIFNHNSIASSFHVRSSSTRDSGDGRADTFSPSLAQNLSTPTRFRPWTSRRYLGRSIYPFRVTVLPTLDRILNEAWDMRQTHASEALRVIHLNRFLRMLKCCCQPPLLVMHFLSIFLISLWCRKHSSIWSSSTTGLRFRAETWGEKEKSCSWHEKL